MGDINKPMKNRDIAIFNKLNYFYFISEKLKNSYLPCPNRVIFRSRVFF